MRARFPVGGGGGGGGGTSAQWQTMDFDDATTTNLGSGGVLTNLARTVVNGTVGVQATYASGVSAGTVAAMGRVVFPLKDSFGNALASVAPGQVAVFAVQLLDAGLPGACRIGVSLQDSDLATPVNGAYVGVEKHVTNGFFAQRSTSPGTTTWAAPTSASSADFIARTWYGQIIRSNSATAFGVGAGVLDGAGQLSRVAASSPIALLGAGGTNYTHLVLRFGCSSALGAVATVKVAVKLFIYDLSLPVLSRPFALPTPVISKPTSGQSYPFALCGHSVARSNIYTHAALTGTPVPAGWSLYDDNTLQANWPASGVTYGTSLLPQAIADMNTIGVTPSAIHRRATAGQQIVDTGFDAELGTLIQDMYNRGVTPKSVWVWHGLNDSQTAGEAAAFLVRARLTVELIRSYYPDAAILLLGERATAGGYSEVATVQTHKATIESEYQGVYFISATSPSNAQLGADGVHFDDVGLDTMGARAVARLAA